LFAAADLSDRFFREQVIDNPRSRSVIRVPWSLAGNRSRFALACFTYWGEIMSVKLYVGNISFQTTQQDLEELFGKSGQVESVSIVTDRDTGQPRGFAFVEMSDNKEAQAAIQALDGKEVDGRALKVNEARPREDRGRRDGFGGGGYGGGGGRGGRY
jgi:cold-inducible RNA-binding protein